MMWWSHRSNSLRNKPWLWRLQILCLALTFACTPSTSPSPGAQDAPSRTGAPSAGTPSAPTGTQPLPVVDECSSCEAKTEVAPAPRPDYEQADLDPTNDAQVAPPEPLDDCHARLSAAGVRFKPVELPLKQKRGQVFTCGAEQVVLYQGGPAGIRYNAAPMLTCRMALALARFEQLAQDEARRHLGESIKKLTQLGTYSCRKMVRFDYVSEHSYANAIDIQTMTLASGRRLTVEKDFGPLAQPPATNSATFLRTLAHRAYDEYLFSVVLTPHWDKLHRDHFHLDLARYRVDGTR